MKKKYDNQNENGFSLLEMLVVIGIIGLFTQLVVTWSGNVNDASRIVKENADKEELKALVRVGIDCASTLATIHNRNSLIRGKNGQPLGVERDGVTIIADRWHLKLAARSASGDLDIRVSDKGKNETQLFQNSVRPKCP